jgi:hypothetical protein
MVNVWPIDDLFIGQSTKQPGRLEKPVKREKVFHMVVCEEDTIIYYHWNTQGTLHQRIPFEPFLFM